MHQRCRHRWYPIHARTCPHVPSNWVLHRLLARKPLTLLEDSCSPVCSASVACRYTYERTKHWELAARQWDCGRQMHRMKLLLDTDIGSDIDDAMALLLALRLPNFALEAVTTVYGHVDLRAKIAKKLLDLDNRSVPVAKGRGKPIYSPYKIWHAGIEGQGILDEPEIRADCSSCGVLPDAVELMTQTARAHPGEIDIVSIGPLTNLARAIESDVSFKANVRRIWAMIGGISYPDPAPPRLVPETAYVATASHNIKTDVGAARRVITSGIPIVMVGNDVTTRVRINLEGIARIERCPDALSTAVMRLMHIWLDYRSHLFGHPVEWTCLHDALVVAEAYGMGFTEREPVDVEIFDDGSTEVRTNSMSHIEVCKSVRSRDFMAWYIKTVAPP